jgi:membrane protein implicated in regulation of membrane protease activity
MDPLWHVWWAWIVAGFALAVVEVLIPGFFFVGFAIGAVVTGILIGTGVLADAGLPLLLLVFALVSLVAWIATRAVLGKRTGQVKIWDRDINEP